MWIRQIAVIALLSLGALASAQESGAPASPQLGASASRQPESDKRLAAFATLIAAACTPELTEQARKESKACALIWYALDAGQSMTRLPNALAKSGYRPIVGVIQSEDGDPLKTIIKVAHPQSGLVASRPITQLAAGMTVEYLVSGAETLRYHYSVIGVIFPALCKTYPEKCGMKTYKSRVFDLREYNEDNFDSIAPSLSSGFPS